MKDTDRYRRRRGMIAFALFVLIATVLLVLVAHFSLGNHHRRHEIARLASRRNELLSIADRRRIGREQGENDKRVVFSVLSQCRAAADIPDLDSDRVVAHQQGHERLCLYVPRGSHSLEVSCTWEPQRSPNGGTAAIDVGADEDGAAGEETWRVPLRPASGYWLSFTTDRKGGPVRWRLTGNHPEFEPQSKRLPLDGFAWLGSSSWSGSNVCVFPNQIEQHMPIEDLRTAASRPPGVRLVDTKLFGRRHDIEYEVSIDVRLISAGPASVPASDVIRILLQGGGNLLQPYAGGGKYELRGDTRQPAPAPKGPPDPNSKAAGR